MVNQSAKQPGPEILDTNQKFKTERFKAAKEKKFLDHFDLIYNA